MGRVEGRPGWLGGGARGSGTSHCRVWRPRPAAEETESVYPDQILDSGYRYRGGGHRPSRKPESGLLEQAGEPLRTFQPASCHVPAAGCRENIC